MKPIFYEDLVIGDTTSYMGRFRFSWKKMSRWKSQQAKSTFEEVKALIEEDWIQAAELLPPSYQSDPDNFGRVSQGTANGFSQSSMCIQNSFKRRSKREKR